MIRIPFVAWHLDRNGCWSVEGRVEDVGFGWRRCPCAGKRSQLATA